MQLTISTMEIPTTRKGLLADLKEISEAFAKERRHFNGSRIPVSYRYLGCNNGVHRYERAEGGRSE